MDSSESNALVVRGPLGDERNMLVLKPFTTKAYKQKVRAKTKGKEPCISPEYILQQARMMHGRNMLGLYNPSELRQRAPPPSLVRLQAEDYVSAVPETTFAGFSSDSEGDSGFHTERLGAALIRHRRHRAMAASIAAAAAAAEMAPAAAKGSCDSSVRDDGEAEDGRGVPPAPVAHRASDGSADADGEGVTNSEGIGDEGKDVVEVEGSTAAAAESAAAADSNAEAQEEAAEVVDEAERDLRAHAAAVAAAAAAATAVAVELAVGASVCIPPPLASHHHQQHHHDRPVGQAWSPVPQYTSGPSLAPPAHHPGTPRSRSPTGGGCGVEKCRADNLLSQLRQFQGGPPGLSYITSGLEPSTRTATGCGGTGLSSATAPLTAEHLVRVGRQHPVLPLPPSCKESAATARHSVTIASGSPVGDLSVLTNRTWDMRAPGLGPLQPGTTGTNGGVCGVSFQANSGGGGGGGEHVVRRSRARGPSCSLTGMSPAPAHESCVRYGNQGLVIMLHGSALIGSGATLDGTFRPPASSGTGGLGGGGRYSGGGGGRNEKTVRSHRSASAGVEFPLHAVGAGGGEGCRSHNTSPNRIYGVRGTDRSQNGHRRLPQNSGFNVGSSGVSGGGGSGGGYLPPAIAPTTTPPMPPPAALPGSRTTDASVRGPLRSNNSADLTARVVSHANSRNAVLPLATLTADGDVPPPPPPPPPQTASPPLHHSASQLLPELHGQGSAAPAAASASSPAAALFRAITGAEPVGRSTLDIPSLAPEASSRSLRGQQHQQQFLSSYHSVPVVLAAAANADAERLSGRYTRASSSQLELSVAASGQSMKLPKISSAVNIGAGSNTGPGVPGLGPSTSFGHKLSPLDDVLPPRHHAAVAEVKPVNGLAYLTGPGQGASTRTASIGPVSAPPGHGGADRLRRGKGEHQEAGLVSKVRGLFNILKR